MKVEIKEKYKVLTAEDNHVITYWNKENILNFSYSKTLYCPLNEDITSYYEITEEEKNKLELEQLKKIKELENGK
jgi:hypothetical protein